MAFNGSGVFTRLYNWVVENASPPIEIAKLDTQEEDFATALSNCLLRDGTGLPTAAIPWNSQNLTGVGTLTAVTGTFSGSISAINGTFSGAVTATGIVSGVGSGLTALNGTNISSGTVADARLSANVPLLNTNNAFTGTIRIAQALQVTGAGATGFTGVGAELYSTGTVAGVNAYNRTSSAYVPLVLSGSTVALLYGSVPTQSVGIGVSGNVTVAAPSSGTALTVTGVSGGQTATFASNSGAGGSDVFITRSSSTANSQAAGPNIDLRDTSGGVTSSMWQHSGGQTELWQYNGSWAQILKVTSGKQISLIGVSGSHSLTIADAAGTAGFNAGYLNIPQNAQTANYTLVLADAGKHIYHASGAGSGDAYTIPANGSVAYPIGTAITFVNADSNSVSIAITTDTLTLAGTTTTGTRTLAQNGVATAIKHTSTAWIISGSGVT